MKLEVRKLHSEKKNKDYYALCVVHDDFFKVVCFLSEFEYNSLTK